MSKASFEDIRKKYRMTKHEESNEDLLSLKLEIESYISNLRAAYKENEDLLAEAQDMLLDMIRIIEAGRCQPFKPRKL